LLLSHVLLQTHQYRDFGGLLKEEGQEEEKEEGQKGARPATIFISTIYRGV